jgi:hypothetical protein
MEAPFAVPDPGANPNEEKIAEPAVGAPVRQRSAAAERRFAVNNRAAKSSLARIAAEQSPRSISEPPSRPGVALPGRTGTSDRQHGVSCRPGSNWKGKIVWSTADALGSPDQSCDVVPVSRANGRWGGAGKSRRRLAIPAEAHGPAGGLRPRVVVKNITSLVKVITRCRQLSRARVNQNVRDLWTPSPSPL